MNICNSCNKKEGRVLHYLVFRDPKKNTRNEIYLCEKCLHKELRKEPFTAIIQNKNSEEWREIYDFTKEANREKEGE